MSTSEDRARLKELLRANEISLARQRLLNFTTFTFPGYYVNWHHRFVCQKLDDFVARKIKRLMVFMPPRTGKSELVSRRLPAFIMGRDPDAKIIATSYSADLASMMNRDVQRIMESDTYHALFPESCLNIKNIRTVASGHWLRNSDMFEIVNHAGAYRSAGVGGGITGMGGSYLILDDLIKNKEEADSPTYREKLFNWYNSTLYTRLEKDAGILLTVTRWHEDDIAGRLLALAKEDPNADQWEVIEFPAIKDTNDNPYDPREFGQALWPDKFSNSTLDTIKATVGSRVWEALYQQRPSAESGNIVKREWWRYYDESPKSFDKVIQAWDLAFTDKETSDFVAGVVLGKVGANIYILDLVHGHLSFTATIQAFEHLSKKWPAATGKYVEQAANGFALIDALKKKIQGVIGVSPLGSKLARLNAVSPMIEAGNVFVPKTAWADKLVEEFSNFPTAKHDDIMDATVHGLSKLSKVISDDWRPVSLEMTNIWSGLA